jgi:hypothetical protein
MSDNVTVTAGTGTTIHADKYTHSTLGSGKTQLVKLVDGTLDQSTAVAAGGGVEANALRVTIASDSTGVVSIDDNGGSITVDGTFYQATQPVSGTVAVTNAGITSIDGKITACNTGAVVLAAGSAAIGKLAANSGVDIGDVDITSIAAGDNNIGNVDIASIAAGTNLIGAVKRDVINYTAVRYYYTYSGAVTDGIVWSPASGKKWVITDLIINTSAAATVTLEEDKSAGDAVVMKFELAANGGVSTNFQTPLMSTEDDADLIVTTSAGNIYITVSGYEID